MSAKVDDDGFKGTLNRRRLLRCAAWGGAGVVWALKGGVPRSLSLMDAVAAAETADLKFVQISDSHIGFNKDANPDPNATLVAAIDKVTALPSRAAFMLHTGDVSHLSKPEEFDTARQIIGASGLDVHYVPGEHDVLIDNGKDFFARFNGAADRRWYSFDALDAHFIALVNVLDLQAGGLGRLGDEQLAWLEKDLRGRSASTPLVIFTHMPLWNLYPEWGWGTDDSAQALRYVKRFGSVTVLNGHVHQVLQKVEGHVSFHTAMSTAFPQPAPGTAPSPGPMKVPAEVLRSVLGVREVTETRGLGSLAVVDRTLA
jgi:3',5'-cyclic-AMP phosphodiesterase